MMDGQACVNQFELLPTTITAITQPSQALKSLAAVAVSPHCISFQQHLSIKHIKTEMTETAGRDDEQGPGPTDIATPSPLVGALETARIPRRDPCSCPPLRGATPTRKKVRSQLFHDSLKSTRIKRGVDQSLQLHDRQGAPSLTDTDRSICRCCIDDCTAARDLIGFSNKQVNAESTIKS